MNSIEVETKIKLKESEVANFKKRIKEIATFKKKGKKTDNYFAIQKDKKSYPKKSFRIRSLKDSYEVTFKKHIKKFWTKNVVTKQEFTLVFLKRNDINDFLELFRDLGFSRWIKKIKDNETYCWKKDKRVSIEINKVKHLGYFIEIEYLAKESEVKKGIKKIKTVLKELEIKNRQIDNTGYTKMLMNKGIKGTKFPK